MLKELKILWRNSKMYEVGRQKDLISRRRNAVFLNFAFGIHESCGHEDILDMEEIHSALKFDAKIQNKKNIWGHLWRQHLSDQELKEYELFIIFKCKVREAIDKKHKVAEENLRTLFDKNLKNGTKHIKN